MGTKFFGVMVFLGMASCTQEYSLEGIGAKEKTVLFCMPSTLGDTTLIQVSRSVPVGGKAGNGVEGAEVSFMLNGRKQTVEYAEQAVGPIPEQSYFVVGALKEGDRVDLSVSCPGLPAVSSYTRIPSSFPLEGMKLEKKGSAYGDLLQFCISFADRAGEKEYYGVRILQRNTVHTLLDDEVTVEYETLELQLDDEPLIDKNTGLDDIFDLSHEFYNQLYIWDDAMIDGKSYTLHLNVFHDASYTDLNVEKQVAYKVFLYKLSEEMYLYLKSVNSIMNNDLGATGLAPIRSHYSNVDKGIGLVGGCNIYESDWLSYSED